MTAGEYMSSERETPSAGNTGLAFAAMTILFFIWGFITALNDILIPHLKGAFDLSYTQVMLVQFCFFGAYFIVSPLAGKLIEKVGYRHGIIIGLILMTTACLAFYPAAEFAVYAVFLLALFLLAAGITILQVSANPYVAVLGPERTATSRLNFAQAINSLGHTLGPLFGTFLILSAISEAGESARAVQLPYLILAGAIALVAFGFSRLKLPAIRDAEGEHATDDSLLGHKHLVYGALAIFLYVGAEVSIGSFLVNFFGQKHIAGLAAQDAGKLVSYYWGAAMLGRFIGAAATRYIAPARVLAFNGLCAIALLAATISSSGQLAMWSVIAVGFFNSVMFPTIFTLAIRQLGPLTSRGSGLLCQAIVGGAIIPLVQGVAADITSVQASFMVPIFCYAYIIWYAIRGSALKNPLNANSVEARP